MPPLQTPGIASMTSEAGSGGRPANIAALLVAGSVWCFPYIVGRGLDPAAVICHRIPFLCCDGA